MAKNVAIIGERLNEVGNWEDWRQYEEAQATNEISRGDADDIGGNQTLWVESATTTNLPAGMTQGFLTSKQSQPINGVIYKGQEVYGTGAMQTRYFNGASWSAWQ